MRPDTCAMAFALAFSTAGVAPAWAVASAVPASVAPLTPVAPLSPVAAAPPSIAPPSAAVGETPLPPEPPPPPSDLAPASGQPSPSSAVQPSPQQLRAPVPPSPAGASPPSIVLPPSRPPTVLSSVDPPLPPPPPPPGNDELANPGYVPGYRSYQGLSLSPYSPRTIALPGGVTPAYGAPMPLDQWTFSWSGIISASLQESIGHRAAVAPGQASTFLRAPPQTIDEYASFVGTSTMPGQWAALNFSYAKPRVGVFVAINTWNPTEPTTFYQIGGQLFINTFHLQYDPAPIGKLKLRVLLGHFPVYSGSLGQYGPGMYTNHLVGIARGVGSDIVAEYPLSQRWTLLLEEGFIGTRNGQVPSNVVPTPGNGGDSHNPIFPSAWVHHSHVGLQRVGETTLRIRAHYFTNWARDDRTMQPLDNRATRAIDESHPRDGRLDVLGVDGSVNSKTWGYLSVGGSYVRGRDAFSLKGLTTFGNDGQSLTERWWGVASGGTGKLFVAGANYSASLRRIASAPLPFTADRPDVILNAGVIVAYTLTSTNVIAGTTVPPGVTLPGPLPADSDVFNHRLRYKGGADLFYSFASFMGAGVRVDRVAPTSKDSGETFHVLALRLALKSNWSSRDTITLTYGKWFYGPRSHPEASSIVASDIGRLDDQLFAINANLSW